MKRDNIDNFVSSRNIRNWRVSSRKREMVEGCVGMLVIGIAKPVGFDGDGYFKPSRGKLKIHYEFIFKMIIILSFSH